MRARFLFQLEIVPMSDTPKTSLSYKDAGVDIEAGNALVDRIKGVAKRTRRPEVMAGLGGFGALCQLPTGYKDCLLYTSPSPRDKRQSRMPSSA